MLKPETMNNTITIKAKTRKAWTIKCVADFIPHLKNVCKSWKRLTPLIEARLLSLLQGNKTFKSQNEFYLELRKSVLEMRRGTSPKKHYTDVFGWDDEEIQNLFNKKSSVILKTSGGFTPAMKEFWTKTCHMSENEAIAKVSNLQTKLASRPKDKKSNKLCVDYYLDRGIEINEAVSAISLIQKRRRNNCREYWIEKGYTEGEISDKISEIQRKRSQWSIDYWLNLGHDLEQAQVLSYEHRKSQQPTKNSKISLQFFESVIKKSGVDVNQIRYGENEYAVQISNRNKFFLDFIHIPSKRVIEFDGRYWHSFEEAKERDQIRDKILSEMGFKILRISETYVPGKLQENIEAATKFIKEGIYETNEAFSTRTVGIGYP